MGLYLTIFMIGSFWLFISLAKDVRGHLLRISESKKHRYDLRAKLVAFIQLHMKSKQLSVLISKLPISKLKYDAFEAHRWLLGSVQICYFNPFLMDIFYGCHKSRIDSNANGSVFSYLKSFNHLVSV